MQFGLQDPCLERVEGRHPSAGAANRSLARRAGYVVKRVQDVRDGILFFDLGGGAGAPTAPGPLEPSEPVEAPQPPEAPEPPAV
jgi:hypothetical protein